MNVGPGYSSTVCMYCSTQLTFPSTSQYIKCPTCQNTFPAAPPPPLPPNYVTCAGCNTLLSHPPTSMTIQCPKCLIIMDLVNRTGGGPGALAAGGPGTPGGPGAVGVGGDKGGLGAATGNRKKRKDPAAPKRASNAYMIFCKERRVTLKQERPDLPFGQLGKTLGEMWRSMSVEEKKPWEDRATSERDRYKQEMNTYQTNQMLKAAPDAGVGGDPSLIGGGGASGSDGNGSDDPSGSLPEDGEGHKKIKLQQSNDSESEGGTDPGTSTSTAPNDAAASNHSNAYLNNTGDLNGTGNGNGSTAGEETGSTGANHLTAEAPHYSEVVANQ